MARSGGEGRPDQIGRLFCPAFVRHLRFDRRTAGGDLRVVRDREHRRAQRLRRRLLLGQPAGDAERPEQSALPDWSTACGTATIGTPRASPS